MLLGSFDLFRLANAIGVPFAMGMRREVQQNILAHKWRKIDSLWSLELRVHCKCRHSDFMQKFFQT